MSKNKQDEYIHKK